MTTTPQLPYPPQPADRMPLVQRHDAWVWGCCEHCGHGAPVLPSLGYRCTTCSGVALPKGLCWTDPQP
jgi:hypothetical protein